MYIRCGLALVLRSLQLTDCSEGLGRDPTIDLEQNDSWLHFPTRHGSVLVHRDCVHHFDDDIHVEPHRDGGDLLSHAHHQQKLPPCPYMPRWVNASSNNEVSQSAQPQYYSDWVASAVATGDFSYMSSDWVVPSAPKSTGPVPGMSSVYFFNGLENGGGHHGKASYILQPVLTYGKSGCIINPLSFFQWHFVSFSVTAAGRAYCGKRLAVEEGERIRGIMQVESDQKTWTTTSIRLKNNDTSVQSTNLADKQPDAAYVVLETMVNYNCQTFPAEGSLTFKANTLKSRQSETIHPSWRKELRHTECHQDVQIATNGDVAISWNTGTSKSIQV